MSIGFDRIEIIRSNRKTIGLEVKTDGRVIVRAPSRLPLEDIKKFVADHEQWIHKHLEIVKERRGKPAPPDKLSMEEIRELAEKALKVIPGRVEYYAEKVGVTYGRITIRNQKSRWGSCSAKGNLNFNCLLMLMPPEVLDCVVVHELCHRLEMNHSPRFWACVARTMPDYASARQWLRNQGQSLIDRLPKD